MRQPQSATSAGESSFCTKKPSAEARATPVLTQKKMKPEEKPARCGAVSTT